MKHNHTEINKDDLWIICNCLIEGKSLECIYIRNKIALCDECNRIGLETPIEKHIDILGPRVVTSCPYCAEEAIIKYANDFFEQGIDRCERIYGIDELPTFLKIKH